MLSLHPFLHLLLCHCENSYLSWCVKWYLIMAAFCPNTDGIGCFIQWECFLTTCILSSCRCEQLPILSVLFENRASCLINCILLYPQETLNPGPRSSLFHCGYQSLIRLTNSKYALHLYRLSFYILFS